MAVQTTWMLSKPATLSSRPTCHPLAARCIKTHAMADPSSHLTCFHFLTCIQILYPPLPPHPPRCSVVPTPSAALVREPPLFPLRLVRWNPSRSPTSCLWRRFNDTDARTSSTSAPSTSSTTSPVPSASSRDSSFLSHSPRSPPSDPRVVPPGGLAAVGTGCLLGCGRGRGIGSWRRECPSVLPSGQSLATLLFLLLILGPTKQDVCVCAADPRTQETGGWMDGFGFGRRASRGRDGWLGRLL